MRNQTLLSILRKYRQEIHASDNPAHNSAVRDSQVHAIQSEQERLWRKHDWPFLRVQRYLDLAAGQRYYDPRGAKLADGTVSRDLGMERLEAIEVRYGAVWAPLDTRIGVEHYAFSDSDLDSRAWPARAWQIFEEEQVEIWPIPSENADTVSLDGRLRLIGIRDLRPLVADSDRADLDDDLLIKYAAAKFLAGKGGKDAQIVLDEAKEIEAGLTGNFTKAKKFSLSGCEPGRPERFPVTYRPFVNP